MVLIYSPSHRLQCSSAVIRNVEKLRTNRVIRHNRCSQTENYSVILKLRNSRYIFFKLLGGFFYLNVGTFGLMGKISVRPTKNVRKMYKRFTVGRT